MPARTANVCVRAAVHAIRRYVPQSHLKVAWMARDELPRARGVLRACGLCTHTAVRTFEHPADDVQETLIVEHLCSDTALMAHPQCADVAAVS